VTSVAACERISQDSKNFIKIFNFIFTKMKTLGKLNINPEKLMKNEELLIL